MSRKRKAHFPKRRSVASATHASNTAAENVATESVAEGGTGWVRCTLTATFYSDAHLGAGAGGEGIDALVARDKRDRPVIWASHLEGVLREAARRILDPQEVDALFGHAGTRQRAVFTSLYTEARPETRIWRSTARAAFDNRAPKDETLRVVEYVPKDTEFRGEVELPANDLQTLKRLLKEVNALGAGRATGAGRVKLALSRAEVSRRTVGEASGRLVLLLRNRDPLCITATATPDNVIPSFAYVPGRTLLGALAAWLIAEGDRETGALLTSGRISVSDALPLPEAPTTLEDVEVLPAPLSLQSEKPGSRGSDEPNDGADGVPWWAQPSPPVRWRNSLGPRDDEVKLQRPADDLFVYRTNRDAPWKVYRPGRRVRLRNARSSEGKPLLFAIEQIVEDTYFLAELHGSPEDMATLAKKLAPVLEGSRWLRVGRAGAPVEVAELAWLGPALPAAPTKDDVLLTLTSDLLVRDEFLRWRTTLKEAALRELLGDDVELVDSLQESVMVHGFNGTSRLWRMPAAAIRRGSVFWIAGPGVARFAERAARGEWLGERTHEGFGRFRIDAELPGLTAETSARPVDVAVPDVAEETAAAKTRAWFETYKQKLKPDDRKPSISQWRDLVADCEREDGDAISKRLHPTTAGAQSWTHRPSRAVLEKLENFDHHERAVYAHLFVRWLSTDRKDTQREGER